MNELIKELFQKSGGIVEVCDVTQDEVLTYTHEMDVEKFAQLIVNECVNVINKRYMGDNNREDMEVLRCVNNIKESFGIK